MQLVVHEEEVKAIFASESMVLETIHEEELQLEEKELVTSSSTFAMDFIH